MYSGSTERTSNAERLETKGFIEVTVTFKDTTNNHVTVINFQEL